MNKTEESETSSFWQSEKMLEQEQTDQQPPETEEDSIIMSGDNMLIVDSNKYNADIKEAKCLQINHIVGKLKVNKKATNEKSKKAEFEFIMELKTLISRTKLQ